MASLSIWYQKHVLLGTSGYNWKAMINHFTRMDPSQNFSNDDFFVYSKFGWIQQMGESN